MYDALLGMILGAGLVLAFQELRRQINAYKVRRWHRRAAEAIALLPECECWPAPGEEHAVNCSRAEPCGGCMTQPGMPHAYYCPVENWTTGEWARQEHRVDMSHKKFQPIVHP